MATSVFFRDKHTAEICGAAIIPTWLWSAVMDEAREQRVSANTVVKTALRTYLANRREDSIKKIHGGN